MEQPEHRVLLLSVQMQRCYQHSRRASRSEGWKRPWESKRYQQLVDRCLRHILLIKRFRSRFVSTWSQLLWKDLKMGVTHVPGFCYFLVTFSKYRGALALMLPQRFKVVSHAEVGRGMKIRPTETGDTAVSAGEKGKLHGSTTTGAAGRGKV